MDKEQGRTDWGCVLPAIMLVVIGVWLLSNRSKPAPPAIQVTSAPVATTNSVASSPPKVEQPPSPPSHNYSFVEEDVYGYISAVSEEDRKRGRATGDVLLYRYAGYWDDEYHLEELSPSGDIIGVDTCTKPCVAIKSYRFGRLERIAYNPNSVIGAAFEDVLNGALKRKAHRRADVKSKEPPREPAPSESELNVNSPEPPPTPADEG